MRDFLKPCSVGSPLLNVLIATASWLSSRSLYTSQYLSEYAFRVSPSCMDKDNSEPRGLGTLVLVIKREQKSRVSYLYELMEFVFRPLNHLIAIDPKLDGKILHIRASFCE